MSTALVGGTVVGPEGRREETVLIEGGVIAGFQEPGRPVGPDAVDVSGKLLLPGGVDVHTHLASPSGLGRTTDDYWTGTRAAAVGGTTTVVDFAPQARGQRLTDLLDQRLAMAEGQAAVDYGFHLTIADLSASVLADIPSVVARGATSFKTYMAYKGEVMLDDGELFDVMEVAAAHGALTCVHAENGLVIDKVRSRLAGRGDLHPGFHEVSRPPETEVDAVRRAIMIASLSDSPVYLVHVSTRGAVQAIAEARAQGLPVHGETCTHYLTLSRELYDGGITSAAAVVLTPPIRSAEHQEALWAAVADGRLDVVSSDHCPHNLTDKLRIADGDFRRMPNGGPGIEQRFSVLYGYGVAAGRITLERFVELTATKPAEIFGLAPRKGRLVEGADADVVVLDPSGQTSFAAERQHQNVDHCLWEGVTVPGRIDAVYSRGRLVAREGRFVGERGWGRYVSRQVRR